MNSTKFIFAVLIIFLSSCSKKVDEKDNTLEINQNKFFPEKTEFASDIFESLGDNKTEYILDEYKIYCKENSFANNNIDYLIELAESSIKRVKQIFEIDELLNGFYIVMLDSEDEMEEVLGMHVKGLASGKNDVGIFVFNTDVRPYFKHELFHLIAFNLWGKPKERLLDEGGAIYSDNQCLHYENPISTINKFLYEEDKWFDTNKLINNFNEKAGENDLIAYLQAGFIFRYLYENYEIEKMKELWLKGFSEFENIYGFNISELENKIETEIEKIPYQKVDWDELMEKGCG